MRMVEVHKPSGREGAEGLEKLQIRRKRKENGELRISKGKPKNDRKPFDKNNEKNRSKRTKTENMEKCPSER